MKNTSRLVLAATLITVATLLSSVSANAATAYPVKSSLLSLMNHPEAVSPMAADAPMAHPNCPACSDVTKKVTKVSKGTETSLVNLHTCASCQTQITMVGTGKQAHRVATHSCASGTVASCCQ